MYTYTYICMYIYNIILYIYIYIYIYVYIYIYIYGRPAPTAPRRLSSTSGPPRGGRDARRSLTCLCPGGVGRVARPSLRAGSPDEDTTYKRVLHVMCVLCCRLYARCMFICVFVSSSSPRWALG